MNLEIKVEEISLPNGFQEGDFGIRTATELIKYLEVDIQPLLQQTSVLQALGRGLASAPRVRIDAQRE